VKIEFKDKYLVSMNLKFQTVMTEHYFDPKKIENVHAFIYLHYFHKDAELIVLDDLYNKLENYIGGKNPAKFLIGIEPPIFTIDEEISKERRIKIEGCK
jgi:hypothetical protein